MSGWKKGPYQLANRAFELLSPRYGILANKSFKRNTHGRFYRRMFTRHVTRQMFPTAFEKQPVGGGHHLDERGGVEKIPPSGL